MDLTRLTRLVVGLFLGVLSGPAAAAPVPGSGAQEPAARSMPAASAPASGAPGDVRVVRMRDLLRQAVEHYQRSEFEEARSLLDEILGYVKAEQSRVAQEAWTYLAFVQVAYGEPERAVAAFERALAIEPSMSLAAPSPKIAAAFAQAQRRYRARVRALDHDPPAIEHAPLAAKVRHGAPVVVHARVLDVSGVERVRLSYRIRGSRGYASVQAEQEADGQFVASIPTPAVARPGVEYYLEAWDTVGNGPALKGSPAVPITVAVEGGPLAPAPPPRRSWYEKWWVWAIVSGAAVAAGGVAAAVYLTRDETARVHFDGVDGLRSGVR